jgi:predicted AAA+ superfamily ATPase
VRRALDIMEWIERDLEKEILKVFKFEHKGAFVSGMKRVGKTELAKKIGREAFAQAYYIDLSTDARLALEDEINITQTRGFGVCIDYDKRFVKPMFERFFLSAKNRQFLDSKESLLILDEIQESFLTFDFLRKICRGLDAKVIIIGSSSDLTRNRASGTTLWETQPSWRLGLSRLKSLSGAMKAMGSIAKSMLSGRMDLAS